MAARVLAIDEPALAAGDIIDRYEVVSLAPHGQQLAVARGQYNRQIVLLEDFR